MNSHPVPGPAEAVEWSGRGAGAVLVTAGHACYSESPTGVPGEGAEVLNCQQLLRQPL